MILSRGAVFGCVSVLGRMPLIPGQSLLRDWKEISPMTSGEDGRMNVVQFPNFQHDPIHMLAFSYNLL